MSIQIQMYDTNTLLGVFREMEPASTYFRDLTTTSVVTFDDEYVDFEKVSESRKLAPLIVPMAQGRPIYKDASSVTRMKPAYLKPKDPVSPGRTIKRRPGENLFAPNATSPAQRYNTIIADIMRAHREAIDRREEWMVARGVIDGKVELSGPDYPTRMVDYQRDPSHTVTLSTTFWDDSTTYPIMDDIQEWIDRVRRAKFGGPVSRITVGAEVLGVMLKNESVLAQLDMFRRGSNANLNTGLRSGEYVEYIGNIGPNIELWVNSDYYDTPDGNVETFLDPKTVVLSGPNVNVVRCFGAILDDKAGFNAMPVFPKMWANEDPAVTYVMSQSAPLPVVVNPNNTLSAKVLA